MSLGQIIAAGLASTASEAANLKFINCEQSESDFDFGTNTGSGIGSTSNPTFAGLTPMQIAQLLTGGNISNF